MSDERNGSTAETVQLVTFHCGRLLVGLDLSDVQEINRRNNVEEVPEAPAQICGVTNLRGEVITMIDLRVALQQPESDEDTTTHNVFVRDQHEVIGLVTDGVSDILAIPVKDIDASPANVKGTDASCFRGVHTTEDGEILVVLDLKQLLDQCVPAVAAA